MGKSQRQPPTAPDEVQSPTGDGLPTAHRIAGLCWRGPAYRGACPLSDQAATAAEAEDPSTKAQAKKAPRNPVAPRFDQRAAKSETTPIVTRDDHQVHAASTLFLGFPPKSRVSPLSPKCLESKMATDKHLSTHNPPSTLTIVTASCSMFYSANVGLSSAAARTIKRGKLFTGVHQGRRPGPHVSGRSHHCGRSMDRHALWGIFNSTSVVSFGDL